jgi:Fic family protein
MLTELKEKKAELDSYKPFSDDFKVLYDNLNLLDLTYMNLKLNGSNITREGVNEIIKGEVIQSIPLLEHLEVSYYRDVLKAFNDMLEMDMELDETQLMRLYKIISGKEDVQYRADDTMLYHLDYTPPHHNEIKAKLKSIFREIFHTDFNNDAIQKAVTIHNLIIKVYPFEEKNEALARTAMEYELMRNGLFVIPFDLSEQDYNSMLSEYLNSTKHASNNNYISEKYHPLYENLISSEISKTDILLDYLKEE